MAKGDCLPVTEYSQAWKAAGASADASSERGLDAAGLHEDVDLRASVAVGLWFTDADGKITFSNPAAHRIWHGAQHMGPRDYGPHRVGWADTGKPIAAQDWGLARARSPSGEIAGAIAANEDVTAFHHTQEQLRSAVRDRERILAIVAHDLRSPLTAVMSYAAVIERRASTLPGGDKLRRDAAALEDVARRMSGLVEDLLAVSVVESEGSASLIELAPIDPKDLIAKAADDARSSMTSKGLQLEINAADDLHPLQADGDRILRVLSNLLDNARKFTDSPGRVAISAKPTATAMLFSVSNTGTPVPLAELEAMFKPFWQAQPDRNGTGLGLAICRSIVEAHGGTIWAEPSDGQRLRICFALPRA